jgi:hypothetical protein
LDAVRFLRDIADPQGGLQRAVGTRHGVSQIRSLHARRYPNVVVQVELDLDEGETWTYRLEFNQTNQRVPIVEREVVKRGGTVLRERPDPEDEEDPNPRAFPIPRVSLSNSLPGLAAVRSAKT